MQQTLVVMFHKIITLNQLKILFHSIDKFKILLKSSFKCIHYVRDVILLLSVLKQEPLMPKGLTVH